VLYASRNEPGLNAVFAKVAVAGHVFYFVKRYAAIRAIIILTANDLRYPPFPHHSNASVYLLYQLSLVRIKTGYL
jgi:hypothetical protein